MPFAFTVKLPGGDKVTGNISGNSSREAVMKLASEMQAQLTPVELENFTELRLRMIGASDSFRRVAATGDANGAKSTGAPESQGNAGVAAKQAAGRQAQGAKK